MSNPICSVCGHGFGQPKIPFCPFDKCWVDELGLENDEIDAKDTIKDEKEEVD